jgi:predicted lipoprotein with Yx(FWY)xxD motif
MRSRTLTVLTVLGFIGVTGGALALAGGNTNQSSAASGQYCPPKSHGKGCKKHHPPPCPPQGKGCKKHRPPHPPPPPGHGTMLPAAAQIVSTRFMGPYGWILVNGQGHTLYAFTRDNQSAVTCTGTCATMSPPDMRQPRLPLIAARLAHGSLLGSDPYPAGGNVVTYNAWPLYTYSGDRAPGVVNAEGLSRFGGSWYVVSPAGNLIK